MGFSSSLANDQDTSTYWQAANMEQNAWWQVDLENILVVSKLKIIFPTDDNSRYWVEVSEDGTNWKMAANQSQNIKTEKIQEPIVNTGSKGRYLRITFVGQSAAMSEVEVFGR